MLFSFPLSINLSLHFLLLCFSLLSPSSSFSVLSLFLSFDISTTVSHYTLSSSLYHSFSLFIFFLGFPSFLLLFLISDQYNGVTSYTFSFILTSWFVSSSSVYCPDCRIQPVTLCLHLCLACKICSPFELLTLRLPFHYLILQNATLLVKASSFVNLPSASRSRATCNSEVLLIISRLKLGYCIQTGHDRLLRNPYLFIIFDYLPYI